MIQEEKESLIKDLCSRLPYNCMISIAEGGIDGIQWADVTLNSYLFHQIMEEDAWEYIKPYLRPMNSMTEEERNELRQLMNCDAVTDCSLEYAVGGCVDYDDFLVYYDDSSKLTDWLNKNMFDYRGLIPKGFALEAPEGMYNN